MKNKTDSLSPTLSTQSPLTDSPLSSGLSGLLELMAKLRSPEGGCPWDIEQTFASIAPHTIEEAYEVADAIDQGEMTAIKDELGDLLFQVVFYAQMAKEQGDFDFFDIVEGITEKMVRRHPHIFADQTGINSADDQIANWESLKEQERKAKADTSGPQGALTDVSHGLPALMRAVKLQKRAARVGFDWPDTQPVFDKFQEEMAELEAEIKSGDEKAMEHEMGDVLLTCVNLSRKLGIDPETALRHANSRFESRFSHIETSLWEQSRTVKGTPLDELEMLWTDAKAKE
ncbi:MAG: nucleoside triphosphate pyrophosphohydrolase [Magnetovibrio sp.]|nr:nucleoside triphosphate pyrophosphohydrolase [Magnetovibrio sp.]